jgi:hypothetical protein
MALPDVEDWTMDNYLLRVPSDASHPRVPPLFLLPGHVQCTVSHQIRVSKHKLD